ncbi:MULTISPECIES: heparin/heparin-sulfate lyase HepB [unclassified Paenibacillus]|uniref:heparin/heparin-sulfate lyase HepB n=1 Tax=unclassified Paenibacillus TaxID=185978 RepID=UPI0009307651|nr:MULTISPECIES: heparin/heparin-sulfate lyase HepB [unclassified Paenibacillus]
MASGTSLPLRNTFDQQVIGAAPSGYTVTGTGGTATIADPAGDGNKAIKLQDTNADTPGVAIAQTFVPATSGKLMFEVRYKYEFDATNAYTVMDVNVMGHAAGQTASVPAASFSILPTGATRFALTSTPQFVGQFIPHPGTLIASGAWYTMKILMNMDEGTYDAYLTSDQLTVEKVPYLADGITRTGPQTVAMLGKSFYTAGIASVSQISFATKKNSGTYYVDDINVIRLFDVKGAVKDSAGEAVGSAQMQLFAAADTGFINPLASAETAVDGSYTLLAPDNGSYVIKASRAGYASQTIAVTVADGSSLHHHFQLPDDPSIGRYGIGGKVTGAGTGQPLANVTLNVYKESDKAFGVKLASAVTGPDGSFVFTKRLESNRYVIKAAANGYMNTQHPVALYDFDLMKEDIRMPAAVTATWESIPKPPAEHPRLYVRQQDIPALQAKIEGPMEAVWQKVKRSSESGTFAGRTSGIKYDDPVMEFFSFPNVRQARYVKVVGYGTGESLYNSIAETAIYDSAYTAQSVKLQVQSVSASLEYSPGEGMATIDGNYETRWNAEGDGHWLQYDLGSVKSVGSIGIAKTTNFAGKWFFDVLVSSDAVTWSKIDLSTALPEGELYYPLAHGESTNYSLSVLRAIEANAAIYLLEGDAQRGQRAVTMIKNYLRTVKFTTDGQYELMGNTIRIAGMVYDWCYDFLTSADKTEMINGMELLAGQMEIGYPPVKQGSIESHGAGLQLLRNQLAGGVAIYDEKQDMYRHAALRFFKEMMPAANFFNMAHMNFQGDSYGPRKIEAELWAQWTFRRMGIGPVYDESDAGARLYRSLYERRPDGLLMTSGDSFINRYTHKNAYAKYPMTWVLGASYYDDPYLQSELLRQYTPGTVDPLTEILFVDLNIPAQPVSSLPLTKYFDYPTGAMIARTGWDADTLVNKNSATVIADMKVGGYQYNNHQHLDMGSFQIYYKGALALDSGIYEGSIGEPGKPWKTQYGSLHDRNYHKQSIAHNTMLVYDPGEEKRWEGGVVANDGGQRRGGDSNPALKLEELVDQDFYMGKVLGHQAGPDTNSPAYSYLKGDLTAAYSSKVKQFMRSFVFLNMKNNEHPAAMVVLDKVAAADPSFKKYWLLHSMEEPVIAGNQTTIARSEAGYNGKLVNNTLLPEAGNTTIEKIGGPGREFEVFGTNYPQAVSGSYSTNSVEAGAWRIQVSPTAPAETDYFLNVLQVMNNNGIAPLPVQKLETDQLIGAQLADQAVLFSKDGNRHEGNVTFQVYGSSPSMNVVVADLTAGVWKISRNGRELYREVTEDGGLLHVEGAAGTYALTYLGSAEAAQVVKVQLVDSRGNPLSGGEVQYYDNGWKSLGTTDSTGTVIQVLPDNTYNFNMIYEGTVQQKVHDTGSHAKLLFQTVKANVKLIDSAGNPLYGGAAKYFAGEWRSIGTTGAGGTTAKELLPGIYTFSMDYDGMSTQLEKNIGTDSSVVFRTVSTKVRLVDSAGNPLEDGSVSYYAGGWRSFGEMKGGEAVKELLPGTYSFTMNYQGTSSGQAPHIGTTTTVTFQTIPVKAQVLDGTGNPLNGAAISYYGDGWRSFGTTAGGQVYKELLPGSYLFAMSYAGTSRQAVYAISAGNPNVIFQ